MNLLQELRTQNRTRKKTLTDMRPLSRIAPQVSTSTQSAAQENLTHRRHCDHLKSTQRRTLITSRPGQNIKSPILLVRSGVQDR